MLNKIIKDLLKNKDVSESLNKVSDKISSGYDSAEMVTYGIWGAVVTTTRAFGEVIIKVDPNISRVFVSVDLRWWAKYKRFEFLRKIWLARAERRAKQYAPEGWKLLVYYEGGIDGRSNRKAGRCGEESEGR